MKLYFFRVFVLAIGPGGIGVRHPPKTYASFFCSLVISIVYSDSVRQRSLAEGGPIPYWAIGDFQKRGSFFLYQFYQQLFVAIDK